MRIYSDTDIAYDMRFADMISQSELGRTTADLSKLSAPETSPQVIELQEH